MFAGAKIQTSAREGSWLRSAITPQMCANDSLEQALKFEFGPERVLSVEGIHIRFESACHATYSITRHAAKIHGYDVAARAWAHVEPPKDSCIDLADYLASR